MISHHPVFANRWVCYGLALLAAAAGCGGGETGGRVMVRGEVTADGQPVPSGSISFMPAADTAGPSATGRIDNGRYAIPADQGPVAGRYTAVIQVGGLSPVGSGEREGADGAPANPDMPGPANFGPAAGGNTAFGNPTIGRPTAQSLSGRYEREATIEADRVNEIDFAVEN